MALGTSLRDAASSLVVRVAGACWNDEAAYADVARETDELCTVHSSFRLRGHAALHHHCLQRMVRV